MKLSRVALLLAVSACAFGFDAKSELLANFDDTQKKILALAEAIPAEKYAWRPAEGVRSVSEVFMHIAGANYMIPSALGAKPPSGISRDMEKTVTAKPKVLEHLKQSFPHVRGAIAGVEDPAKATKLFGRESTSGNVQLLILTHLHEHLGQAIAYARMNDIAPPWSAGR